MTIPVLEPLLPCPFCGGGARWQECLGEFWVDCLADDCGGGPKMRSSLEAAVAAWNRRAHASPPAPFLPECGECMAVSEIPGFGTDRDTHRCAKTHGERPVKPGAVSEPATGVCDFCGSTVPRADLDTVGGRCGAGLVGCKACAELTGPLPE